MHRNSNNRWADLLTLDIIQKIDKSFCQEDLEHILAQSEIYSWPQMWSNTACGFGGIAGQAFTKAQTTIIIPWRYKFVMVFHADRFAYLITYPNTKFLDDMKNFKLMGAADYKGQYEQHQSN